MEDELKKGLAIIRQKIDSRRYETVSKSQEMTRKGPSIGRSFWVQSVTIPRPSEVTLVDVLAKVIQSLGDGSEAYCRPNLADVNAEWVINRNPKTSHYPAQADPTQRDDFRAMEQDMTCPVTVLYVHGGAFYTGSPASSRGVVSKLAKLTGGRCLSLQYRLAPQNPFPTGLLDLIVAYLSLLQPPEGALHATILASSIVLAGDRTGANLCFGLMQFILELGRRQGRSEPTVLFNGHDLRVSCPAGLATLRPNPEQTLSLPSKGRNREYDWLGGKVPHLESTFPACEAWPASPPRGDLYCESSALTHPLVSPVAAQEWKGGPPLLIISGQDIFEDGNKLLAQSFAAQDVCVQWEHYQFMPHLFPFFLPALKQSMLCMETWARFCRECICEGTVVTNGTLVLLDPQRKESVDVHRLTKLTRGDALELMKEEMGKRKVWKGPSAAKCVL
ncbi:MAG: hypothetical protein Q9170_004674 [Blastenia crenularia]